MNRTLRILARSTDTTRLLLRVKELKDGGILYSFPALDGRRRSILYGEDVKKVPPGGLQTFMYAEARAIREEIDHLTLHRTGHHVITSPTGAAGRSEHWGRIAQRPLTQGLTSQPLGLLQPTVINRYPLYDQPLDSNRDTVIDMTQLGVNYIHFNIRVLGTRLQRGKGQFAVPEGAVDPDASGVGKLFKGLTWFLLPLNSWTLLFAVHTAAPPYPQQTTFIRWEGLVGEVVHTAYFE